MEVDEHGNPIVGGNSDPEEEFIDADEIMAVTGGKNESDPARELHEHVGEEAFDDTSGAPLVPSMVAAAWPTP